jgi:hypothetical protein
VDEEVSQNTSGLVEIARILKLPPDVSLIAGFESEDMYIHYEVARVQA